MSGECLKGYPPKKWVTVIFILFYVNAGITLLKLVGTYCVYTHGDEKRREKSKKKKKNDVSQVTRTYVHFIYILLAALLYITLVWIIVLNTQIQLWTTDLTDYMQEFLKEFRRLHVYLLFLVFIYLTSFFLYFYFRCLYSFNSMLYE